LNSFKIIKDEGLKNSCGLTLLAIAQNIPDTINKYSKKSIPFTFFAMHHKEDSKQKTQQQAQNQQSHENSSQTIWENVWEEITSGTEFAVRANLGEILGFVRIGLEHQSWKLRIQSAQAISTICSKLQSNIELTHLNEIMRLLISSLNTRTWSGKDKLLIAITSLFNNCKLKLNFENPLVEEIIKSVFKEANKSGSNIDISYKLGSLRCLADLVEFSSCHFKDNLFEDYWQGFIKTNFSEDFESLVNKEKKYMEKRKMQLNQMEIVETDEPKVEENDQEMKDMDQTKEEQNANKTTITNEEERNEEEDTNNFNIRLNLLSTIGKCWSYSSDIQGEFFILTLR